MNYQLTCDKSKGKWAHQGKAACGSGSERLNNYASMTLEGHRKYFCIWWSTFRTLSWVVLKWLSLNSREHSTSKMMCSVRLFGVPFQALHGRRALHNFTNNIRGTLFFNIDSLFHIRSCAKRCRLISVPNGQHFLPSAMYIPWRICVSMNW